MLSLLVVLQAAAQDNRVSAEQPSRDSAIQLVDALWDILPEDGVVVYMDCSWPDCHGQVPHWFEREDWAAGLIEGGLVLRSEDIGISPETLESLWQASHDRPPILALALARELDSNEAANALVYLRPRAREHRLDVSWEVHQMRSPGFPEIGRIVFRPLPPPLPDPRADMIPWAQHRSVWGGAALVVAGGAMLGGSWSAWSAGAPLDSPGLTVINTAGWLSTMGGGMLMVLPLIQRN